jgi:hypothetical protein
MVQTVVFLSPQGGLLASDSAWAGNKTTVKLSRNNIVRETSFFIMNRSPLKISTNLGITEYCIESSSQVKMGSGPEKFP